MKTENIKRYYPAIIVVLVLVIVAAAGTLLVAANLRNETRQVFTSAAEVSIAEIENDFKSDKSDGQSIAQSYLISAEQSRASQADYQPRLKLLYDNISRRDQDLVMVGVALRINGADRGLFEKNLSDGSGVQTHISIMNETGAMQPDMVRDEYFPIAFIEPRDAAGPHIGMNIATSKVISSAMAQAKSTGFPAISATLPVRQGDQETNGYCIVVPIVASGMADGGTDIAGYVIEYDSYKDLLNDAAQAKEGFAGMAIFDTAAPSPLKPVAVVGAGFDTDATLGSLISDKDNFAKKLNLKSHDWTIVAIPHPTDPAQIWQLAGISAANAAFIILIAMYMFSSIRRSLSIEAVEADLRLSYTELSEWAEKSEKRAGDLTMLREMSEMLQTCDNRSEAFLVMSLFMYKLFRPHSGGIYLLDKDRTTAEIKVSWGKSSPEEKGFQFNDCIALRRSSAYNIKDTANGLICQHVKNPTPSGYICLPMTAQGEIFGLFYLSDGAAENELPEKDDWGLATTVAEQLAITLANINLRERLREQSLTDHLTKLFNRRYMEDMLEREVRRADRNSQPIGFIMFDIDFFKNINDTYGHDAGDTVLETLGIFLKTSVRVEDIACRYGGEEFLLVMPGSDRVNTLKRANEILEKVQLLSFEDDGKVLPPIHLSGGVAMYPDDSSEKEKIVSLADEALYEAKRTGRNRVVVWTDIKDIERTY